MTPCMVRELWGGSAQGGQTDYREAALAAPGRNLEVPSIGGGYTESRV